MGEAEDQAELLELFAETAKAMGVLIYDPRDGAYKYSDNPALIARDLMQRANPDVPITQDIDNMIISMANYCDEQGYELNIVIP